MTNLIQWYGPEIGTGWDSTHVYRSTTETGTYSLVATVTPITTTKYWDTTGDSGSWYKIAFYRSSDALEGPLSSAFYASATATLYTNPTELRKFMQFNADDFPNDEDATLLLEQAHVELGRDIIGTGGGSTISNTSRLKLLSLLIGSCYVCRSLATKALSKGYVAVSLEGGNIMKAHDALMRLADYYYDKYLNMLAKDTVEHAKTEYMNEVVESTTQQDIIDIQNGVSDALDYEGSNMPSIGTKWHSRSGN